MIVAFVDATAVTAVTDVTATAAHVAALVAGLLVDDVSCHLFSKHFWLLSPRNPRDENHMKFAA
jgi:hypothetical protein